MTMKALCKMIRTLSNGFISDAIMLTVRDETRRGREVVDDLEMGAT
jgi:hypothetical protein